MKKFVIFLLSIVCITASVLAASINQQGDINGDGLIDDRDVTILWQALADSDLTISEDTAVYDVNGDGVINLRDVTLLQRYQQEYAPLAEDLKHYEVCSTIKSEYGVVCTAFRFGKSVLGRDLVCWSIEQGASERTVLLNFAIHGWEDSYAADGQLLVELGNALVAYCSQSEDLKNCRLLIIPCANPDGVADGTTNNGFGRCNADGVDLNRDFDANHVVYTNARNKTLAPFSAPESRALRDLCLAADPDVVVDFHGWLNYTIGNSDLAEVFSVCMGINHNCELTTGAHGYFSYWAQLQGAEAILVEFKDTDSIVLEDTILAIDRLITNNYGKNQCDYPVDEKFSQFDSIVAYAMGEGRIYTQKEVGQNETEYGYIVGGTDECTIMQIYENGWCKVRYPVGSLTKTGYCELSAFIPQNAAVAHYTASASGSVTVYSSYTAAVSIGSVWATDQLTVVAEEENMVQIIYPLDGGGYKMGWIRAETIQ